ncbi:MAG: ATP-binding protein [bacterium]
MTTLFIATKVYRDASEETRTFQGLRQLETARSTSVGVQYFLHYIAEDLHLLTSFLDIPYTEANLVNTNMDHIYEHVNRNGAIVTFVADKQGNVIYSRGDPLPPWVAHLLQKRIAVLSNEIRPDDIWLSRVERLQPGDSKSPLCLVMLEPILQDSIDENNTARLPEVVGMAGFLLDFDWLMQRFIMPIRVGKTGFAWVMDQHGRLLFHPRHPEMVLRSIYKTEPSCGNCHDSFQKQQDMIHNRFGYQVYQVGNEPTKILAQAQMTVSNEEWVIAVSIDLAEVTANIRKNFRLFFWQVGFVVAGIILGGILLLFVNVKRVQAEAHSRYSEEKRLLQEQIDQAAKLASIGELVDSVAHEVNTPVGIISAQVDAIILQAKEMSNGEGLQVIKEQTRRIANYTHSLLRFSRRRQFQLEATNLSAMTEESLTLLGHRIRSSGLEIEKIWPKNLPAVMADRNQLQQVLLNLFNNAFDALDGQGKICVEIRTEKSEKEISGVKILVSDNGPGIKHENLPRIFDPFFSTKPPDEGTGLGLAISQAIVKRHGGWIHADSVEGKGACFTVFIPYHKFNSGC